MSRHSRRTTVSQTPQNSPLPSSRKAAKSAAKGASSSHTNRSQTIIKLVIAGVLLIAVLVIGLAIWLAWGSGSVKTSMGSKTITVKIPQGSGSSSIATILDEAGVFTQPSLFKIQARLQGADGAFKAGTYRFSGTMTLTKLIDALKVGPQSMAVKVTIPEGKTDVMVAAILAQKVGIDADAFVDYVRSAAPQLASKYPVLKGAYKDSLQGYLFPDTYSIEAGMTPEQIAEMMVKRFSDVWDSLPQGGKRSSYTTQELVTVASLVEREAARSVDRPKVASVIYNRLDKGMRLGLCSSIQWLLPGKEAQKRVRLTDEDVAIKTPYNTYTHKGLPPGPIANPGKAALEAAISPAKTKYLYFQAVDLKGTTKFDSTYAGFQKTKAQAKKTMGK